MDADAIDEFIEFFEKNARLRSLTVGGLLICHSGNVEDNYTGVELFKKIKNKDFSKPIVLGHM